MNYEEFNRLFNLQSNPAYKNLGKTNCEIGFFVERNYPENIAFKPSLTKDGNVDDISIIYVKYKNFDTCAKSLDNYMPISIAIYKISNYLTKRSQSSYDYENNNRLTLTGTITFLIARITNLLVEMANSLVV